MKAIENCWFFRLKNAFKARRYPDLPLHNIDRMYCLNLSQDKETFIRRIKAEAVKEIQKKKRELRKAIKDFFLGKQLKAFRQILRQIRRNCKEQKKSSSLISNEFILIEVERSDMEIFSLGFIFCDAEAFELLIWLHETKALFWKIVLHFAKRRRRNERNFIEVKQEI